MPIRIPDNLPARKTLEHEGVVVMDSSRAARQDIRPLQIGLLNLMPNKERTETQFTRLIGSEIITMIINYRWNVRLTDVQNGFRALRRDVGLALGLREDRFAIEEEMVMKALQQRYRVVNVSSHEYKRRHGVSKIVLQRDWFSFIWTVIKHVVGIAG